MGEAAELAEVEAALVAAQPSFISKDGPGSTRRLLGVNKWAKAVEDAAADKPKAVRVEALRMLQSYALDDAQTKVMWGDAVGARAAILASVALDQHEAVSTAALGALRNLAFDDANTQPIWRYAGATCLPARTLVSRWLCVRPRSARCTT